MALFRTGNSKLLEIKCSDFTLTFTGKLQDKKSSDLQYNKDLKSDIIVNTKYNYQVNYANDDGKLMPRGDNLKPRFFENGGYQIVLEGTDEGYDIIHYESDISKSVQAFGNIKVGTIEFESEIGYSTFAVTKNGKVVLSVTIEVFPSKLDYKSDYEAIMTEVNEEISEIIFRLIGNTVLKTKLKETDNQTNSEYFQIFRAVFEDLEKDIRRICNNLKHNVQTVEQIRKVEKARVPSRRTIDYLRKHPNALVEDTRGFININDKSYLPTTIIDKRKITTVDIFENRLVKYMLSTIVRRLDIIEKNISDRYKDEGEYIRYISEKKTILKGYLKRYFSNISDLQGRKTMSLVFQMSPGYKDFYKKYQILKKGLVIDEGIYNITPKKLHTLYEIWCYVKINKLLNKMGYKADSETIIRYKDNGLYLSLMQDKNAEMLYTNGKNNLSLWYNKVYTGLPTTTQKPDTVLCIKNLQDTDESFYIFDAKYRINTNGAIGPMEDDINVMHRYRDSIVSKMKNTNRFKFDIVGAYVMFPYNDEETFKKHKFYKSIEEVNIGAFPMLPSSTSLIEKHLKKITGIEEAESNNTLDKTNFGLDHKGIEERVNEKVNHT